MAPTFASLFGGFRGVDIGAQAAGFDLTWSLEYDPRLAEVGAQLPGQVHVLDILDADPSRFDRVDALHASPPCTRASAANKTAELNEDGLREAPLDIALANKVIEFVETLRPKVFTLENVWGYRRFQSWQGGNKCEGIYQALSRLGYWADVQHVNAADLGVPQSRKRMIVRAVLGGWVPVLPSAEPHRGWYQAIEDLIPGLPETQFANWQVERLPEEIRSCLIGNDRNGDDRARLNRAEPGDPAFTISASHNGKIKAFLVAGSKSQHGKQLIVRDDGDSASTVVASGDRLITRAYLVYPTDVRTMPVVDQDRPAFTVMANGMGNGNRPRALLIDGQNADRRSGVPQHRADDEPSFAITNQGKGRARAWMSSGRVVSMTPRALARFQSFPDWYELPEKNGLAYKGIGNACPPLEIEKIYRQLGAYVFGSGQ